MPGYLDEAAQEQWKVKYRYHVSGRVDPAICQTYPWRLLPYLDWGYEPILGYQPDENDNVPSKGKTGVIEPEALEVADQPWFGYNAYYVGGWWETDCTGNITLPILEFDLGTGHRLRRTPFRPRASSFSARSAGPLREVR